MSDLTDQEYDECLAATHKHLRDHEELIKKHKLAKGKGPSSHAQRVVGEVPADSVPTLEDFNVKNINKNRSTT